ncbi:MAG: DUF6702 family protein [Bacteroidota bacterium]
MKTLFLVFTSYIFLFFHSFAEKPAHAIYLSLTEIELTEDKAELRVKVFSDDLRDAIKNHDMTSYQGADVADYFSLNESIAQDYFGKYLELEINGLKQELQLTGHYIEGDAHFVSLTCELPESINELSVSASFLMELFPTQLNVVNVKKNGQTQYLKFSHPSKAQILNY